MRNKTKAKAPMIISQMPRRNEPAFKSKQKHDKTLAHPGHSNIFTEEKIVKIRSRLTTFKNEIYRFGTKKVKIDRFKPITNY